MTTHTPTPEEIAADMPTLKQFAQDCMDARYFADALIKMHDLIPRHSPARISDKRYQEVYQAYENALELLNSAKPAEGGGDAQRKYECGCVSCICENEVQCQGCGAKACKDFKGASCEAYLPAPPEKPEPGAVEVEALRRELIDDLNRLKDTDKDCHQSKYIMYAEGVKWAVEKIAARNLLKSPGVSVGEWMPIETIKPTAVLDKVTVCCATAPRPQMAMVSWPMRGHDRDWFTTMDGKFHAPTHWMNCPAPPTALKPFLKAGE